MARQPSPPPSRDELCEANAGVLAVRDDANSHVDLILYNHAPYASLIVDCNVTVTVTSAVAKGLAAATVRRVDERHANPLAAWIRMGAPDYTNASQNAQLLASSQLVVEQLSDVATIAAGGGGFVMAVPVHGVAAVRVVLAKKALKTDDDDNDVLRRAAQLGDGDGVSRLLSAGASIGSVDKATGRR